MSETILTLTPNNHTPVPDPNPNIIRFSYTDLPEGINGFLTPFEWIKDEPLTIRNICERMNINISVSGVLEIVNSIRPTPPRHYGGITVHSYNIPDQLDEYLVWGEWKPLEWGQGLEIHHYLERPYSDDDDTDDEIDEIEIKIEERPEGFAAIESSKDPISLTAFEKAENDVIILPCCKNLFLANHLSEWFKTCLTNGDVNSINCPLCRIRMNTLNNFQINESRCIITVYRAKQKKKVGGDKRKAGERDSEFALDADGNIIYNSLSRVKLRF